MKEKYQKIKKIVEKEMAGVDLGHDLSHTMRVYDLCLRCVQCRTLNTL